MSDKSMPERIGVAENRLDTHEAWNRQQDTRIAMLEAANKEREGKIIKAMWGVIKAIGLVTGLTILGDMTKEGCRVCKALYAYLTGQN